MRPLVVLVSPSLDEEPAPASPIPSAGAEPVHLPPATEAVPPRTVLRVSPPAPPLGVRPAFVPPTGLLDHARSPR